MRFSELQEEKGRELPAHTRREREPLDEAASASRQIQPASCSINRFELQLAT